MEFNFQRYLEAKRPVDDRALHARVWESLGSRLPRSARVFEAGCGTGYMLSRLWNRGLLDETGTYLGIDSDGESIAAAKPDYPGGPAARFECADLFEWSPDEPFDLVIAASFLDLVDLERALPRLRGFLKPGGIGYFPFNFDGVTIFEPAHPLDEDILAAYHASMNSRPTGGDSRTGRKLFRALQEAGFGLIDAGPSDWIVRAGQDGAYPGDEAYFLQHILHFFEGSCAGVEGLEPWLADRRRQVRAGELVYIAHQLDFLVQA